MYFISEETSFLHKKPFQHLLNPSIKIVYYQTYTPINFHLFKNHQIFLILEGNNFNFQLHMNIQRGIYTKQRGMRIIYIYIFVK